MSAWRVVKMSTNKDYEYVALEFDMLSGSFKETRVCSCMTDVRKRSTTEFEICENGEWMTIPYSDVPSLMKDFNKLRASQGKACVLENEVLRKLYTLEYLR